MVCLSRNHESWSPVLEFPNSAHWEPILQPPWWVRARSLQHTRDYPSADRQFPVLLQLVFVVQFQLALAAGLWCLSASLIPVKWKVKLQGQVLPDLKMSPPHYLYWQMTGSSQTFMTIWNYSTSSKWCHSKKSDSLILVFNIIKPSHYCSNLVQFVYSMGWHVMYLRRTT